MRVDALIGELLAELGTKTAFGVVGSGNFHMTRAMADHGVRFVACRHEGGAASAADGYARLTRRPAVLSLHQGCGYTNALTGITEAAKSATPLIVLTADTLNPLSNFHIDQPGIATGIGAVTMRVDNAETAAEVIAQAWSTATSGATVVVNVPIDVQEEDIQRPETWPSAPADVPDPPSDDDVTALVDALMAAERPVFIAGRGARGEGCREALLELASSVGALVATSAVNRGLFHGDPFDLDVSGGFSTPLAAELISQADLVVSWGCALNMWTTRHGRLIAESATRIQVDRDQDAIGKHRRVDLGIVGDTRATAELAAAKAATRPRQDEGYRTNVLAQRIAAERSWNNEEFDDLSDAERIDPRVLTRELNSILPADRTVSVDSGNFLGYPSMFLDVPDENALNFTQSFQCVGLGIATGIGSAIARPDRLPIVGIGDGGFSMGISELETAVRLGLPMVFIVYNDAAYGAEVHHFGPEGVKLDEVTFPDTDFAAIARGYGCEGITVRTLDDLEPVRAWVAGDHSRPLVIDAKIATDGGSWWLQEAFGH